MIARAAPELRLSEEAASWFLKLNAADCSDAERRAFDAWLAASEAHRAEYHQYERLWQTLDRLPAPRSRRIRRASLVTLAVIGMLAALCSLAPTTEHRLIATGIGERQHIALADGSTLDVNANSRVRTDIGWFSRIIEVESGEALFSVAHEALRPFEVRAANGIMRDIGTIFDVAHENGSVTVGVIEGIVQVRLDGQASEQRLNAGQRLAYSASGQKQQGHLDVSAATAWKDGRWVFENTPLPQVVAEMNRQHTEQTELVDPTLMRLQVSGAFNIADRTGLLKALEALYPVHTIQHGNVTQLVRNNQK